MVETISLLNSTLDENLIISKVSTDDFILDYVDWGTATGTHSSYKYLNQIGETIYNTVLSTRPLEIQGWVIASSDFEMTARKGILNKFFNPMDEIKLTYDKYSITFKPEQSVKYTQAYKDNNEVICKFKVTGLCPYPLFVDSKENEIILSSILPTFTFPFVIPEDILVFGYRSSGQFSRIINNGSFVTGMRILFRCNAGTVTNPILTNVNTQEFFKLNVELQAGQEVEVNTNIGERNVICRNTTTGEQQSYFKYRDFNSSWLQLKTGENLLKFDADADVGNLSVFVYFYNRYLEVEQCS